MCVNVAIVFSSEHLSMIMPGYFFFWKHFLPSDCAQALISIVIQRVAQLRRTCAILSRARGCDVCLLAVALLRLHRGVYQGIVQNSCWVVNTLSNISCLSFPAVCSKWYDERRQIVLLHVVFIILLRPLRFPHRPYRRLHQHIIFLLRTLSHTHTHIGQASLDWIESQNENDVWRSQSEQRFCCLSEGSFPLSIDPSINQSIIDGWWERWHWKTCIARSISLICSLTFVHIMT